MIRIPKEGLNLQQLAAIAASLKEAAGLEITKLREAAATELYAIIELVRRALSVSMYPMAPNTYFELYAIYPDRAIVRDGGRLYAFTYAIDANNQITVGGKGEVIESYTPVTMTESAPSDAFIEAVNEEGSVWDVTVIRSGLSLNSRYYPDKVLREAAPLFEGARVFVKSDADHTKGAGKDVRNIAGWITGVKFTEGKSVDSGRLVGQLHLSAAVAGIRTLVADAWKRGKRDLVGLSIDAEGKATSVMREGKRVVEAQRITKVSSVDLIVEPGAGGQLIRMVESFNQEEQDMKLRKNMLDTIQTKAPAAYAKINAETITDDELLVQYTEALAKPETPATGAAPGAAAAAVAVAAGQPATLEQINDAVRMVEARGYARATVMSCTLPQAAKEKLAAEFAAKERFTEADVDARIKGEREYLARFTESGRVTLDLGDDVTVESRRKKIDQMMDDFFAQTPGKPLMSFKECYIEITGDRRVSGRLDDCDRAKLREASSDFRESLDSGSFTNVLGNSITRRMLNDYRTDDVYSVWRPIVSRVPLSDFRTQERTRYGGYGDLPIVAESDPYTELGSPTDEKATYAAGKRGGTESVTLEMIKNDDVGAISRIPVKLSRAAKRTLAKFVFDFIRTNPNIYDGQAWFRAGNNNLFANVLSAVEVALHRLAMMKQTEMNSLDRVGIAPKFLVIPFDLQETAVNLFNRSTNLDKTFLQELVMQIIPVWYWTDANDWATLADPSDIPTLEIGFLDGREEPDLFVQDNPTVGSLFSNDKITWKIRHIYGGNVTDFRGGTKAVV
jgi:hypothetical protein